MDMLHTVTGASTVWGRVQILRPDVRQCYCRQGSGNIYSEICRREKKCQEARQLGDAINRKYGDKQPSDKSAALFDK